MIKQVTTLLVSSLVLFACGGEPDPQVPTEDSGVDAAALDVAVDSPPIDFGDVAVPDAGACTAPDFLIVLDRSASMGNTIDDAGVVTKWAAAQDALKALVSAPNDQGLRLGLEVFPDVQGSCSSGTVLVQPDLGHGAQIVSTLSTTKLVGGTPMGAPLTVARTTLAGLKTAARKQFVLLISDGGETCASNKALPAVQALAKDGVKTFVVGFGAGVNVTMLNNLACAGLTAPNLKTSCTQTPDGWTWNGTSTSLFHQAQDGAALKKAFGAVASTTCCSCGVN